jgi:coenzyme F420 hydrogenase subunit beta
MISRLIENEVHALNNIENVDNIEKVVVEGLCTGCGTCVGVCPTEAIVMQISNGLFLPKINLDKCTSCRLCVECCPGYSLNFREFNTRIFDRQPQDRSLGNYASCYVGYSNNKEIRFDSSSGGIATQLLVFALEKGIIDGALVTGMRRDRPLEPVPFIARTKEDVISASKSKYCPVPLNEALKCIIKEKGRFAVVGLPCHIHGFRKAEMKVKGLKEKIALHIGIMCSHTVSFFGTELLLERLGVLREEVSEIAYRGRGWPGSMRVKLKNGSSFSVPYVGKWTAYAPIFSSFLFTPTRCLMCPDETNEFADISIGDAWLRELKNSKNGHSIVVARTKHGEDILNLACDAEVVFLKHIRCERVRETQREPLRFKKDDLEARLALIKCSEMKTPEFDPKPNSSRSFFTFARNLFVFSNASLSEKRIFKRLQVGVPLPIFRIYCGIYRFLCLL